MPPKRRGSQTVSSSTWTELFQRIAPVVLQEAVQGTFSSETVIRQIPTLAITAVQYVKGTSTTTTDAKIDAAASQGQPNKKDNKVDNNKNKKGDISAPSINSEGKPNKKDNKVDNNKNKKRDVAAPSTNSEGKANKKDNKEDNTKNKKGDVSAPSTNSEGKANKKDNKVDNKKNIKGDVSAPSTNSEGIANKKDNKVDNNKNKKGDVSAPSTNSEGKDNKKDNKVDNTINKKGDVSAPSTNSDKNCACRSKKEYVSCCQEDADDFSDTDLLCTSFVHVGLEDNRKGTFSSETVIREIPAITKTAVQYVQKGTSTKTTDAKKDAAASQVQPNKKNEKVDNKKNKKGDVSAPSTNIEPKPNKKDNKVDNEKIKKGDVSSVSTNIDNNYDCASKKECANCCQEDADDFNDTDLLGTSFVHVELEDNVKCNISQSIGVVIKGLPNHVTEDQVLKELAKEHFYPITVLRKIPCKEYCETSDFFVSVQVPKFIESRLLILRKLLGYKVDVLKQDPESIIAEFTECTTIIDHGITDFSESNTIADLGYNSVNSNNSHSSNDSIHKPDIFSSSRNSIPNSPSVKEECDQSSESIPKESYIQDTNKLLHELREIKKEVEEIKFELKINVAKKVNSDFLHIILQGIPPEIKNEDIVNDLKSKQFSVNTVYRLGNENNEATDAVVFELPKAEDHIFYFSCCLGFEVQVEEYKDDFSHVKYNHASFNKFNTDISPNKPINILFRGIPTDISESDILRDLKEKGFHPIAMHSMVLTKRNLLEKSNHVVLVQVPLEEEHIYELSCILGYMVTVEGVDKGTLNVAQCKSCLQFGHKANMCSGKTTSKIVSNIPDQKCKIINNVPILNAVVKGVPIEFGDEIVISDLIKDGFNPIAIHRMIVEGEILPTYLVQVPEQEKRILELTCCLGFNVQVEKFLPHLYHVEQCRKCSQFGHCDEDCLDTEPIVLPSVLPDNHAQNMVETIDNKEFINERFCDFDNGGKIETENIKKEFNLTAPNSTSLNLNSTQSNSFEQQQLVDKLDNLEVVLKHFITQNNEKHCKICSCSTVPNISTNDTSTNTDNTYAQLGEMEQAIKSYENISMQFLKNMGLFAQAFMGLDNNVEDISKIFEAYRKLKDQAGGTTSFVEAMIRILKSTIIIMLDIPNIPGVTLNTINEQLHLLEELKNIKINDMASTPAPLTKEYDVNFPKLQ